jgi:hypothetical protein
MKSIPYITSQLSSTGHISYVISAHFLAEPGIVLMKERDAYFVTRLYPCIWIHGRRRGDLSDLRDVPVDPQYPQARLRHRVPVVCALSQPVDCREHRLRPGQQPRQARRDQGACRRAAEARRPADLGQQIPQPALRRPAAARGTGPRAGATRPGLLLLDEPLSALDALERIRLRGEIRRLQKQVGITTIMVTHDQEEALSMADRIAIMNHGRDRAGRHARWKSTEQPATPFVADFVGKVNVRLAAALAASVCLSPA